MKATKKKNKQNKKESDNEIIFHGSFQSNIQNTFEKRQKFQLQIIVTINEKNKKIKCILAKNLVFKKFLLSKNFEIILKIAVGLKLI